jgi:hypothetical protein
MSTIELPEPPTDAVAKDAHWAAKMARLRNRKLAQRTLSLCDDEQAKRALADAALALAKARAAAVAESIAEGIAEARREEWVTAHPATVAAASALANAEAALNAATDTLTFRALPRPAWEQLLTEHAPTEAQADAGQEYNVETFPAALISASSVDGMSEQDAQDLLDAWSDSDAKALFTAPLLVNQTMRVDLGKG